MADAVPDLKQEEWPDAVSDLKPEEWPDAVPDLKQESAHAFGDLEEVAYFEEESAHAFVDLEERGLLTRWRTSRRSRQTTRCRWTSKDDAILSP